MTVTAEFGIMRKYHVLIEDDEDGWLIGTVSELPGCHTQARSIDELRSRAREAIIAYLGDDSPGDVSRFVGVLEIEA